MFEDIGRSGFVDGLATVRLGSKVGYIDSRGQFAIEPRFEAGADFAEGLAQVRNGDKWGYIDESGNFVISPQFDQASRFVGGRALVSVSGHQGTIGRDGCYMINPGQYSLNPVAGAAGLRGELRKQGRWKKCHTAIEGNLARAHLLWSGLLRDSSLQLRAD